MIKQSLTHKKKHNKITDEKTIKKKAKDKHKKVYKERKRRKSQSHKKKRARTTLRNSFQARKVARAAFEAII